MKAYGFDFGLSTQLCSGNNRTGCQQQQQPFTPVSSVNLVSTDLVTRNGSLQGSGQGRQSGPIVAWHESTLERSYFQLQELVRQSSQA